MGDTAESVDVTKTTKEGVTKKESEELFSDVSSMEIVEADGLNCALIEEGDENGFIVEDTLSDVSISEILDSNVVLDEAYSDEEEVADDFIRESQAKIPDDVLSDISSVCSVPAVKGKQSSSRSKHSSKSHGGAESAAKKPDGSSDKSQKGDSSRRRHESTNTSTSKASSEKSESCRSSSKSRKLPEGIIPLKDRKDEYRCTVCYCYLASRRIMERHVGDYQHLKRAQHIATIDTHSSSHSSREKRKHEDGKEPQETASKVKGSSDSKKAKLEKTKENKESKEEKTTLDRKNQKETSTGAKKAESEKAKENKEVKTTSDKKNQKETSTGVKKTESEKTKEIKESKEEKTTSDKKNQKETLTGAKKTESEKAKENKGEEKTISDKKNQKETLTGSKKTEPEKTKENKEEKTTSDKKNQKETPPGAKKTESEKTMENKDSKGEKRITSDKKNQKEASTDTKKTESGTTHESKDETKNSVAEKTKESKGEEKSKPDKKNQKETLTDVKKTASDNAEDNKTTKSTVSDNKEQKQALVDKKGLESGKEQTLIMEDKKQVELSTGSKKTATGGVGVGRETVSSSGNHQDKEEASVDTEKAVARKAEESKEEAVKLSTEIKQDISAEASGKEEHKETQAGSKENAEKISSSSSDAKHPVKGKTEESKEKVAKLTSEKKQDGPSEATEKNKDHKESRKAKDCKESLKDKEPQKEKERRDLSKERRNKEAQRDKDHKESQKDKIRKETQKESKKPQKETAKGKECSSSTRKPGKRREREVERDDVASSDVNSASKKPKLEGETDKNKIEAKGDPRVLRHLSDMKQPILGIEEISLSGNDGNWIYHCNLCSVACGSVDIRPHLLGRRHRTSYALYHRQAKPNREKPFAHHGQKIRDIGRHLTPVPRLREERNFREEDPPFSTERSDDWKQAHWNDCCNSFLKITMDRDDSPLRHNFEPAIDRAHKKSFRDHFTEEMESNIRKPQSPHDPRFDSQGPPPQFQQPDYMPHSHFPPPQHPSNPPHFQEYPHFQEPEYPPPFQMPRQPPHFQEPEYRPSFQMPKQPSHFQEPVPPHPPVQSHHRQPDYPMPQQFHQPEPQAEPQFQKRSHHRQLVYPEISEKLMEQKNPSAIPTSDKAAPSKSSKDKPMAGDNAPTTKTSEAAVDIINLMIQDYLKNELQKLPSQLQKILCESKRAEDSKKSMQAASDAEVAKGKNSSRSKLSVEKNTSEMRDSVSRTPQDGKKESTMKVIKRVKPEDVASSFDQHSYKNVENMQTIPFLGVASSSQDLSNGENKRNKSSSNKSSGDLSVSQRSKTDDESVSKDETLNSQNDGTTSALTMDATSNCFEQFIKSWIEHTGAVPIRSSQTESLDKSLKEDTAERKNTGETSNQMSSDFSNIDHAELGRQVAAFLSKHSASLTENIGNILMGKNPQSSVSSMSSEINATIEKVMTSNTSRGDIVDMNRNINPFIDQSNRGHGMNRERNPADVRQYMGENPNVRDEAYYKRVPDNWDGDPRNRGSNPPNQPASYWVASGRDGLPTRIYIDEVDGYHDMNRSEMARGNMDSMPNTYQERRMNTNDIRERQQRDFNRRGRGTLPFRSPHSLSFLDLLNQHRNDPVFNPGISRRGVHRRNYY